MENLAIYEKVRSVPDSAKKTIAAGRLKGMTDIKPMWRIKTLTEQFGVVGFGWKTEIVRTWLDGSDGSKEITANVEIKLYIKVDGEWSEGIPGIGGSKYAAIEKNGVYVDDECYKKAYTDALSVACKAIGIGADVYWSADSKYDTEPKRELPFEGVKTPQNQKKLSNFVILQEELKHTNLELASVKNWTAKVFGEAIPINDLTEEQFARVLRRVRMEVKGDDGQ